MSFQSACTAVERLAFDHGVDRILTVPIIDWIVANAGRIVWCLDIDGTLTAPGGCLSEATLAILDEIVDHTVLITAQAAKYVEKIGAGSFPNLVTEKGMVVRIGNFEAKEPTPSEVRMFTQKMEELLGEKFELNAKTAGYGVPIKNMPAALVANVEKLMKSQAELSKGLFHLEKTDGFIDLTLAHLSKAKALKVVMESFPGYLPIACGDSDNTDGPMLKAAEAHKGTGIMVKNPFEKFPRIDNPADMTAVLKWYAKVLDALKDWKEPDGTEAVWTNSLRTYLCFSLF